MGPIIRRILKRYVLLVTALCISACATTNTSAPDPSPNSDPASVPQELTKAPVAKPEPAEPPVSPTEPAPIPEIEVEPELETEPEESPVVTLEFETIPVPSGAFSDLSLWQTADPTPALKAFRKTCKTWRRRSDDRWLNPALPMFGKYKDWRAACQASLEIAADRNNAVRFFQSHFEPVDIGQDIGLLTAYYAPEIPVRHLASLEFSEPILAKPLDAKKQSLPRKDISVTTSKVLAYGRPVDVFFMQVQGSGQIKFPDGTIYRAAFDGHNGHKYTSIGRVLIKRGDLSADKAGKQDIEDWMAQAGYVRTKQLMAENPRYIFFKAEHIVPDEGPRGSSGVTLTAMGSIAVEPRYYPYGALIWVEGKFPTKAGDYTGTQNGNLLVAQDMGGAIKGKKRGDVFFGSGDAAGAKAGVMKHRATWTLFLPVALALKHSPAS